MFGELVATLEIHSELFRCHMHAESHVEALKFYDEWDEKIQQLTIGDRTVKTNEEVQENIGVHHNHWPIKILTDD
jgi:hypothetical protein